MGASVGALMMTRNGRVAAILWQFLFAIFPMRADLVPPGANLSPDAAIDAVDGVAILWHRVDLHTKKVVVLRWRRRERLDHQLDEGSRVLLK